MEFGVGYFPTHDGMSPGAVARLVEDHGQSALFFAEHTHIPASRESPWPGGKPLPHKYWHTYDLFIALMDAAAATSRLRVGSGICLVVERDPITTAKEVASVDHLSGGRLEFGVGAGWNREEMANHGTDPRTRMKLLQERVEEMRARADRELYLDVIGMPADAKAIEKCHQAGARRVSRWLSSGPRPRVEQSLEKWEAAVSEFTGV